MIVITEQQNFFTIKEHFTRLFSNLKLEFYAKPNRKNGKAERDKGDLISIMECRTVFENGAIILTPKTKASILEKDFRNVFGLGVVVFRKKGNLWTDTYDQKNLTLAELNQ